MSYESYRNIFNNDFNISFGYSRTYTCLTCDEFIAKLEHIDYDINSANAEDIPELNKKKNLSYRNTGTPQRKANTFYNRKSA